MQQQWSYIKFPDEEGQLHRQAKAHAARKGQKLGEWVRQVLAEAVFFADNEANMKQKKENTK